MIVSKGPMSPCLIATFPYCMSDAVSLLCICSTGMPKQQRPPVCLLRALCDFPYMLLFAFMSYLFDLLWSSGWTLNREQTWKKREEWCIPHRKGSSHDPALPVRNMLHYANKHASCTQALWQLLTMSQSRTLHRELRRVVRTLTLGRNE